MQVGSGCHLAKRIEANFHTIHRNILYTHRTPSMHSTRLITCLTLATVLAVTTGEASAKGCLKGAVVGAVAGHVAGHHAVLGAVGGCVVERHMASKKAKDATAQKRGVPSHQSPASEANHV